MGVGTGWFRLPEFDQYNEPIPGTFPPTDDSFPVLNGIIPEFTTNDDLTRELELQPSGFFNIPIVAGTDISIDGIVSDWPTSALAFTDLVNDENEYADFVGTDIHRLYLAKDSTYLYMGVDLYDGDPKADDSAGYVFQANASWNNHDSAGDRVAGVWYSNGDWIANVAERTGSDGPPTPINSYPPEYGADGAKFIEWKVLLNDMGNLSGKFVNVYSHFMGGDSNDPVYPLSDDNLTRIMIDTASVSGTITCSAYDSTGNILVWAFDGPDWRSARELGNAVADAEGNFTIEGLPTGSAVYLFALWDADGNGIRTIGDYLGTSGPHTVLSDGTTVDFSADYQIQEASVSGQITCDKFEAGYGQIYIGVFDGPDPNRDTAFGEISITAPGSYTVNNLPSGSEVWLFAYWDANGSGPDGPDVEDFTGSYINNLLTLSAGDNAGINIDLIALYGKITGTVTDPDGNPIPNLHVYAQSEACGDNWLTGANTDGNGNYTLTGLPGGDCYVRACATCESMNYVDEWYDDAIHCDHASAITVVVGQDTPEINFTLEIGGTISGHVYKEDSVTPVYNVHVYACDYNTDEWVGGANTNQDGSYTIVLPTGSYRVVACASCTDLNYIDEYYDNTSVWNQSTEVPVTSPGETSGIDFTLTSTLTRTTIEEAVGDGLYWLSQIQNTDGSWGDQYELAKTAMAVLAFESE